MRNRVTLEPELEEIALLWGANKRLVVAAKLERWARQLKVSAKIMIKDSSHVRRPSLRALPRLKAVLN